MTRQYNKHDFLTAVCHADLDSTSKSILLIMSHVYADWTTGRRAYMSAETLATKCGCSRRTIIRRLADLEGVWIDAERRHGQSTIYHLLLPPTCDTVSLPCDTESQVTSDTESLPCDSVSLANALTSDTESQGVCHRVTGGVTQSHTNYTHTYTHTYNDDDTRASTPAHEEKSRPSHDDVVTLECDIDNLDLSEWDEGTRSVLQGMRMSRAPCSIEGASTIAAACRFHGLKIQEIPGYIAARVAWLREDGRPMTQWRRHMVAPKSIRFYASDLATSASPPADDGQDVVIITDSLFTEEDWR